MSTDNFDLHIETKNSLQKNNNWPRVRQIAIVCNIYLYLRTCLKIFNVILAFCAINARIVAFFKFKKKK